MSVDKGYFVFSRIANSMLSKKLLSLTSDYGNITLMILYAISIILRLRRGKVEGRSIPWLWACSMFNSCARQNQPAKEIQTETGIDKITCSGAINYIAI